VSSAPPPSAGPGQPFVPMQPATLEETGLGLGFLSDLALKLLYFQGYVTGADIAERLHLPFAGVVDRLMEFLKREMLCEIKGAGGLGPSSYQYTITGKGITRAREVLERGQYVGPAPVTLTDYAKGIQRQPMLTSSVNERMMREALAHLVINDEMFEMRGARRQRRDDRCSCTATRATARRSSPRPSGKWSVGGADLHPLRRRGRRHGDQAI